MTGLSLSGHCYTKMSSIMKENGSLLEIGTFDGLSLKGLAEAKPEIEYFSIDPFIEDGHTGNVRGERLLSQKNNALENLLGIKNHTLFEITSEEFYRQGKHKEIGDINYIIVDGCHNEEGVTVDVKIVEYFIEKGCLRAVIFDDMHFKDVKKAVAEFEEKHRSLFSKKETGRGGLGGTEYYLYHF